MTNELFECSQYENRATIFQLLDSGHLKFVSDAVVGMFVCVWWVCLVVWVLF